MKRTLSVVLSLALGAAQAYLPPVAEHAGVRVEIGSFPQKTDRKDKNPYAWPLGVTEVRAGAPRAFPVTLVNRSMKTVSGRLEVWMNDDWTVTGPQGALTIEPGETKTLSFVGTAKASALDALYPVHARFTPQGVATDEAPHPIAIFRFVNPNAPRSVRAKAPIRLGKGVWALDAGFERSSCVEVKGKVTALPANGDASEWGGGMRAARVTAGGETKSGFSSHPPFRKGAGFLWSDFPLDLPPLKPIRFSCENFLVSPGNQPPSDGVEYRVLVLAEGAPPRVVCSQIVKDPMVWRGISADLSEYAGKRIVLRLWTGPGPKMNTCCDGGGWGDVRLAIGPQPPAPASSDWAVREREALALARAARTAGTDPAAHRYRLEADGTCYGAGVALGARGLIDGVLAFTDGERAVAFRGFTAQVDAGEGGAAPDPVAEICEEKGTLRIRWSLPGVTPGADGFPRIARLSVGPASEKLFRVYAGFGNVIEGPKAFTLQAGGFALSTRHVGVDYANGLSVVQAVDVPPDRLVCDGARNRFSLEAHLNACFTFVPSSNGSFAAARRFRAVSGYRASPGLGRLGARMCLDQWNGDYARAAEDIARAAKYGLGDAIFVKHVWQRWGYDYRLPEIWPPEGDGDAFRAMREACRRAGMLFCPHDNYTDLYPDAANFSYDLVVFNLDGTPQRAWFNPGRFARSYRWAPHAFRPWCLRNAKLLKAGCDPDAVFIDVLTAHPPFEYLDRTGAFHSKRETVASWANAFATYREGYARPDAVCVSEAGQDHLVGTADAGQSDHFTASKLVGAAAFADAERTPWHDIVTHGYYILFAGGLGGRYQEEAWHKGGDPELHGYGSDDYLSNTVIGGRNPMCSGPFSRAAVMTFWLQHDACAELGASEMLGLGYGPDIHCQKSVFSNGGEVWINRRTNAVWRLANGVTLPSYGYYVKTRGTESGVVEKDGVRCAFARSREADFYDARMPARAASFAARSAVVRAERVSERELRLVAQWETVRPVPGYCPFVHVCGTNAVPEGIVFQAAMGLGERMLAVPGRYEVPIAVKVPSNLASGVYEVRYGLWNPKGGGRLAVGGAPSDGAKRVSGGELVVKNAGGRVVDVTWRPVKDTENVRVARDRLLGVNRAGLTVDFGGVRTSGSFRLVHPASGDWMLVPLPDSSAFTAEIDLDAFGVKGRTVRTVEAVEPEAGATAPVWRQEGSRLFLQVDSRAFAYRIPISHSHREVRH